MCAHGRLQLPAFDFLAHLLLILIGFRQSCEGIKLSSNTKINWLAKAFNEMKPSEFTVDITIVQVVTRYFATAFCTLTVSVLKVLQRPRNTRSSIWEYRKVFDLWKSQQVYYKNKTDMEVNVINMNYWSFGVTENSNLISPLPQTCMNSAKVISLRWWERSWRMFYNLLALNV